MSGAPPGPAAWVLREVRPDDSAGLDTISDLHMELLGFGRWLAVGVHQCCPTCLSNVISRT